MLARSLVEGRLTETAAARLRVLMTRIMSGWSVVAIRGPRVRTVPLPEGAVRRLDAIHLGTLLQVLVLDDRVHDNARLLGFTVVPP
jgi:hypothetical protein